MPRVKLLNILLLVVCMAILSPQSTCAQSLQGEITQVANTELATMKSPVERTMDFVDQQIAPPKSESSIASGFNLFKDPKAKRSAIKTGATLTLVISMFLFCVFLFKLKPTRRTRNQNNNEVLAVLGKVPFVHGQELQIVRLGTRLLLVATSQQGSQTLAEINEPSEVLQIESALRTGHMDVITDSLNRNTNRENRVSLGSNRQVGRTLLEA